MHLVPFIPAHLEGFEPQEAQAWLAPHLQSQWYIDSLTALGDAFTLIADGKVVGCGGLAKLTERRAQVWALVHKDAGKHLFGATRLVKDFLDAQNFIRMETPVKTSFQAAHRWALMLGFEREGTLKKWGDDGEDYDSYARIK